MGAMDFVCSGLAFGSGCSRGDLYCLTRLRRSVHRMLGNGCTKLHQNLLLLLIRRLIRPFRPWRQASQVPPLPILPVENRSVRRDSVIPCHNGAHIPLHAALQICGQGNVVVQEFEKVVALFLLEANDAASELWIDVQRLLASSWVRANDGMDVADWLTAEDGAAVGGCLSLLVAGVDSLEAVETFLECGREAVVSLCHVAEERVAASWWSVEEVQEGGARGLHLEADVGMPCHGVRPLLEVVLGSGIAGTSVN